MLAKTHCAAVNGLQVRTITIEVSITQGVMYHFTGLGDTAVREGRDRINTALANNNYHFPKGDVTVNMVPADLRKEGSAYDLPLAIALLVAGGQLATTHLEEYMMIGELSLDGQLQPVKGALPIALQAKKEGLKGLLVPAANVCEAAVVEGLAVYGMETLTEVIAFFSETKTFTPHVINIQEEFARQQIAYSADFSDVRGQESARRAMEVAAAGGHNIIMVGPPGSGKSMIAKRLPSILPPLSLDESLETTQIHSISGKVEKGTALIMQRPFRAPHHTISEVALVGGGSSPMPGEISLAHNGVLFLDELPEFNKSTLEVLRQPLENRTMPISRANYSTEFPCSFMLVASMNPCPCGYYGDKTHTCICTPGQRQHYMGKISGPLMDRIDLQIEVQPVKHDDLAKMAPSESSSDIRQRVIAARKRQEERFKDAEGIYCNAQMTDRMVHKYVEPDEQGQQLLKRAMSQRGLSARAYERILKVARTIADLAGSDKVQAAHIAEAINYRNLDSKNWTEN